MIEARVTVPCTSRADDLAFASLGDVARATDGLDSTPIVGGHMVALLAAAFPVPGVEPRRTTDADAGLSTEVAARGLVVERLIAGGYQRTSGNRFERDGRTIDLLVEVAGRRFRPLVIDEFGFDGSPGLDLALLTLPIRITVDVVYTDGSDERLVVDVPTVEMAVIIKAYAVSSRSAAKDIADLAQLLEIRHRYDPSDVGGWSLDEEPARGRRLDAARSLRTIRSSDPRLSESGIRPDRFVELVREYVAPV